MRLQGWESRLNAVVEHARSESIELGRWDCFKLTCEVIEALTGVDRWTEETAYRTRHEALSKMRDHGGFMQTFEKFFGAPPTHWKLARRGDIACGQERGRSAWRPFGVVVGSDVVFLGRTRGIVLAPIYLSSCIWRVG